LRVTLKEAGFLLGLIKNYWDTQATFFPVYKSSARLTGTLDQLIKGTGAFALPFYYAGLGCLMEEENPRPAQPGKSNCPLFLKSFFFFCGRA